MNIKQTLTHREKKVLPVCMMLIEPLVDSLSDCGVCAPPGTLKIPQGMFKIQKRLTLQS